MTLLVILASIAHAIAAWVWHGCLFGYGWPCWVQLGANLLLPGVCRGTCRGGTRSTGKGWRDDHCEVHAWQPLKPGGHVRYEVTEFNALKISTVHAGSLCMGKR